MSEFYKMVHELGLANAAMLILVHQREVEAAVKAEREACAVVAERMYSGNPTSQDPVSRAIRARNNVQES